jgi:hypothetical protein
MVGLGRTGGHVDVRSVAAARLIAIVRAYLIWRAWLPSQ